MTNLYNSLKENQKLNYSELKSVLLNVFKKINKTLNEEALVSRLVNFIYFKSLTEKWKFTEEQN
ncbi:bacteriocin immunity protein [Enterococcus plantarum]|uniref:bacteriocin immunity protein n=1 Tax=Enterococcus plantarum TaxID=1077675 RepID=UPI0009F56068